VGGAAAAAQRSRAPTALAHLSQAWPLIVGLSGMGVMVLFYIRWVEGLGIGRVWGEGTLALVTHGVWLAGLMCCRQEQCSAHSATCLLGTDRSQAQMGRHIRPVC
jgi:hypothetical protein